MPDIEDLLERTTPAADDLPPLSDDDLADLAQGARERVRRRAQRTRATVGGVLGIAAAALVVGVAGVASDDGGGSRSVDVDIVPAGPSADDLTEPVGSWTRAADPPFSTRNRPFGGRLDDGRIVVWGGESSEPPDPADGPGDGTNGHPGLTDGGIYDPAADSWESIPSVPLPPMNANNGWPEAQLADDRLAVVLRDDLGTISVAVYDVDESRWTVAPAQDDIKLGIAGMVWDGETLALVQLSQGGGVDESLTLRWRPGDDRWTTGVPAPIAARLFVGSASDGRRLALWGGTTDHLTSSPGPGSEGELADGAIYDLAADRWTTIADGPVPGGVRPAVAWVDGRLVVGGGRDGLDASSQELVDVAAYDPATQTWSSRPAAPSDDGSELRSPLRLAVLENTGVDRPLIADPIMGGNDTRLWFYGPDGEWEQSPLPNAQRLAGFWVATSPSRGEPDDTTPFSMQVRVAAGQWLDSAPASFANRDRANTTLVTSGNLLMVVGGHESADLDPATDVWLFDLAG